MKKETLDLIVSIATILLIGFAVVKNYFLDNKKQDIKIDTMKVSCGLKHEAIDNTMNETKRVLTLIQENELKHIEERVVGIEIGMTRIETILNERLPRA